MLKAAHLAELCASGISKELIEASGIRSVSDTEARELLKWKPSRNSSGGSMSGWAIPFRENGKAITNYHQVKPDNPRTNDNDKTIKYENPRGKSVRAYFPPGFAKALPVARTLLITEGPKKALSATSHGYACVGLVGVWGWQQKRKRTDAGRKYGRRELIADLAAIDWTGRQVVIVFDSDAATNGLVLLAEYKLAEALQTAGATVRIVRLPSLDDGKTGLDDFIVAKGPEELQRLIAEAEQAEEPPAPRVMDWAQLYIADQHTGPKAVAIRWHRDEYYTWSDNRYEKLSASELAAMVQRWLDVNGANATPRLSADVVKSFNPLCGVPFAEEIPLFLDDCETKPENIVAFENGLLDITDIESMSMMPHTPNWFAVSRLCYRFDQKATCPKWLEFLDEVLDDEQLIELLAQWFGLCLTTDTSFQKLLLLVGPRRSGKGTICRTLQHVIGPEKCTSPALTSLGGDFGLWQLVNKDVAIFADAHLGRRVDSTRVLEAIKSIVGEDPQNINRKNLPFLQNVRLSTRFVLTVNELPHFSDVSGALVSRLVVIPFKRSFADSMDRELEGKLKAEAPGIFNWALHGLYRLRRDGFIEPSASNEVLDTYGRITSPVSAFLEDCCEIGPERSVLTSTLYEAWKRWCAANGHTAGSDARFGERLRASDPTISRRRPNIEGKRIYRYSGVGLSEFGSELLLGKIDSWADSGPGGPSGPRDRV